MFLLLALVLFLLFAGLGFVAHIMWLGLIAVALILVVHMVHQGLTRGTPTSRLNIRLVAAARGFLDDILETRVRSGNPAVTSGRQRGMAARRARRGRGGGAAETGTDLVGTDVLDDELDLDDADVVEAEIVEDTVTTKWHSARSKSKEVEPSRGAAQPVMTPAKLAKAAELEEQGLPRAEIARRLGVSRSTLYRHLAEHRKAAKARARAAKS